MRTALLAAVKRTANGGLRAEQQMGGRRILAWQVDLVRALGCERIVCLCETPGGEVLALQKQVESDGGTFHAIRGNLQLASLVRADDELVMLQDGLLADREAVASMIFRDNGLLKAIGTIPATHALAQQYPEDFERIDRDRHWAGIAAMRANQVHKLADLPPDGEAMSLLLRLGLQARVECHQLPADVLEGERWMLATSESALRERERALVENSAAVPSWSGPANALGALVVRSIAPRWLKSGREWSALTALVLLLAGALLAGLGLGAWGLGIGTIGAFAASVSQAWDRLRAALWSASIAPRFTLVLGLCVDLLSAITLVLANGIFSAPMPDMALPLIAVGLSRYIGMRDTGALAGFWRDRSLHLLVFATAAAFGALSPVVALFCLLALVQLLLRARPN